MTDPRQAIAARGLLDWTQGDLADKAQIGINTVKVYENDKGNTTPVVKAAIQRALEDHGIEFSSSADKIGVALKVSKPRKK